MRRPQGMCDSELLTWIMNNELEYAPGDYESDCWEAREGRCTLNQGRPVFYWKGKGRLMYRVTWCLWNEVSEFPEGLQASHLCENPKCVNPLHIEPATPRKNELQKSERIQKFSNLPPTPSNLSDKDKLAWWMENHCQEKDGCYLWLGSIGKDGYAARNIRGNKYAIHRWAYCVYNNELYKGDWVAAHTCGYRHCINPKHIYKTSRSELSVEYRSTHKNTKLSEKEVEEVIKDFISKDFSVYGSKMEFKKEWAEKLGVSRDAISNIVFRHRNWKDLLKKYGLL